MKCPCIFCIIKNDKKITIPKRDENLRKTYIEEKRDIRVKTVYLPEETMLPRVKLSRTFASSEKMRPGESTPPRRVVGYETGIYLTDGGEITINGQSYPLSRYAVRFLREGDEVHSRPEYVCQSIYFDFGSDEVFHENELLASIPPFFSGTKEHARLFERIDACMKNGGTGMTAQMNAAMLQLLLDFYAQFHSKEMFSRAVVTCIDYMKAHLSEPISLETLGRITDYSALHVLRLFKRDTQKTPHAYLTALRMASARELLAGDELSVAQIAERCGFVSESHFQSLFKKQTGMTPGQYRKHARMLL